jgi:D-arabinose 1-dehydrogenase-like Zn-dependent alcohol dehydrogenase
MAGDVKIPARMTAVAISQPGGPLVLKPEKRMVPEPGEGEILVKVRPPASIGPTSRSAPAAYPPPPGASDLPGLEIAGEVVALARRRQAQDRRQGDVAGRRRRLRAILHRAGRAGDDRCRPHCRCRKPALLRKP